MMKNEDTVSKDRVDSPLVAERSDMDAVGANGDPNQGPFMQVLVKVRSGVIVDASFETYDCPSAIACGEALTEMSKGRTPQDALTITPEQIIDAAGDVPLGKVHCVFMAISALRKALAAFA